VDPRIRGQALIGRAQLSLPADPAGAEAPARAGLDLCRAAGDEFWTATGLNLLSEIALHTGRAEEAEALSQEAARTAQEAGDGWNQGWALGIRATIAGVRGNIRAAAELASASIDVMQSIDQRWGVARAQLGLGDLARLRSDFSGAQRLYADALGPLREIGARPEIARCLTGLGRVALDLGDIATAREHLGESLRVSRDIGTRIGIARGLESCAVLAEREGDAERAVLLAAAAAGLRATAGLPRPHGGRADRYRAAADRLGDGTAALLWSRGLALAPETAVDLAIGRPDRVPRPARPAPTTVVTGDPAVTEDPADTTPAVTGDATAGSVLTPRELEIAALIAQGRSNKAIAAELFISPATVARHVANIMLKLSFRSRAQIATWITGQR
jgi:DNA-binding CsgD family transcriptional regulator